MKKQLTALWIVLLMVITACKKDNQGEIDTEAPVIDVTSSDAFPKQCSTIKRGETFIFRAQLNDNMELGSVSVDIHHNFDHHTHSTELQSCTLDPQKTPVKPFLLIRSYQIPANLKTYTVQEEISIPSDIDPGDYHFMVRLTDIEGWQTIKGLSVKIL